MTPHQRTRTSKFLSIVLRHRPQAAGVTLDAAGWVDVDALLAGCVGSGRAITREQLEEIIATNDKRRFEFSHDGSRIRASQGHSVDVELGYEAAEPPDVLYHGTVERNLDSIRSEGLIRGKRHHVHLSADVESARIVGARRGRPVVLVVDAVAMRADGREFIVSANGVWLTAHVPNQYLSVISE